jgi:rSAM/selenodomain-associated transferase 1
MRPGWLVVFAKAPEPGRVKTRLCPPLTPAQAAELYRCLLEDAFAESAEAAAPLGLEPVVAADPAAAGPALAALAPRGFRAVAQSGPDLGARMTHVLRQAAAAGAAGLLMRGSDSPALDRATLQEAWAALTEHDVVLVPDPDGGYGLVGLGARALARGAPAPGLFDHPMSTPTVLVETVARADCLGLAVRRLAPGFDIDRHEDLRRLAAFRHRSVTCPCPRTLAFLDAERLWPRALRSAQGSGRR